mmetsp:Transcript_8705/g.19090  ORF Transcript_8705/g.19090 Transcript_8705/m.19090 type:complete len:129 (+) Transcript_8705:212-598(+)
MQFVRSLKGDRIAGGVPEGFEEPTLAECALLPRLGEETAAPLPLLGKGHGGNAAREAAMEDLEGELFTAEAEGILELAGEGLDGEDLVAGLFGGVALARAGEGSGVRDWRGDPKPGLAHLNGMPSDAP